jgi:hypothetical protein
VRITRRVAEDHTVSWDGNRWGVLRKDVCAGLRGAAVEIERRLDGSHWLRYRGRYLHLRPCPEPVRLSASPSGLRPPGPAERTPTPTNKSKPKYHVPAEHPWRKPWNRTFLSCEKTGHFYFALTRVENTHRGIRKTRERPPRRRPAIPGEQIHLHGPRRSGYKYALTSLVPKPQPDHFEVRYWRWTSRKRTIAEPSHEGSATWLLK